MADNLLVDSVRSRGISHQLRTTCIIQTEEQECSFIDGVTNCQ
jgi:hypothetical protein